MDWTEWAVTFVYAGAGWDEDALTAVEDALAEYDATAAAAPSLGQVTVTITRSSDDPVRAAEEAADVLRKSGALAYLGGLPPTPVGVDVLEVSEYARRAEGSTVPDLIGASEAGEILGVSRQRVNQLAAEHATFPTPVLRVRMGPLWMRDAISGFERRWDRRPGRPAKVHS